MKKLHDLCKKHEQLDDSTHKEEKVKHEKIGDMTGSEYDYFF